MVKIQSIKYQMLVSMWSNSNSNSWLVGMQNDIITLEDGLTVSYKTNCAFWYLLREIKSLYLHKNLQTMPIADLLIITQTWK